MLPIFLVMRSFWLYLLLCAVLFTIGCGQNFVPLLPETTVTNLPGEDLAGPCTYALRVTPGPVLAPNQPASAISQTGVLVVFERGDSLTLFDDATVIANAQRFHLAMLYAYQCNAASFDDLQFDAAVGPGRALFQALNQFAVSLNHPELASANVFLTGFSAGGFLSITVANQYPNRVLGTVPYAPASAYANVSDVSVPAAAARIPSLILVSAEDRAAGDQLPLFYFQRGWAMGAPWGFASQPSYNHCCVDSIAPMLNVWLAAIASDYSSAAPNGLLALTPQTLPAPPSVTFQIDVDGNFDPFGWQDFTLSYPSVLPANAGGPYQAWLPNQATTQEWLNWISTTPQN